MNYNNIDKEKEKYMKKLSKEIIHAEKGINHIKIKNLKIYTKRGFKKTLKTCQLLAPYIIGTGLIVGGFRAIGLTPFYRDDRRQEAKIMQEIDSLGNVRYEQQYEDFKENYNVLSYYNGWKHDETGFYYRNIEIYKIKDMDENTIKELINNNPSSLNDILGRPILKKTEKQTKLTKEELNSKPYLQARVYSKDINDFIIVKEPVLENIVSTAVALLFSVGELILIFSLRLTYSDFRYFKSLSIIEKNNPLIEDENYKKILKIKKQNYNRLNGE